MRLLYTFFIQYFARFMQVLSFKMKWSKKELIVQMHMQIWTWDLNTFTWVRNRIIMVSYPLYLGIFVVRF